MISHTVAVGRISSMRRAEGHAWAAERGERAIHCCRSKLADWHSGLVELLHCSPEPHVRSGRCRADVRGVAQLGRAPRLGRGGRRFKSSLPDRLSVTCSYSAEMPRDAAASGAAARDARRALAARGADGAQPRRRWPPSSRGRSRRRSRCTSATWPKVRGRPAIRPAGGDLRAARGAGRGGARPAAGDRGVRGRARGGRRRIVGRRCGCSRTA